MGGGGAIFPSLTTLTSHVLAGESSQQVPWGIESCYDSARLSSRPLLPRPNVSHLYNQRAPTVSRMNGASSNRVCCAQKTAIWVVSKPSDSCVAGAENLVSFCSRRRVSGGGGWGGGPSLNCFEASLVCIEKIGKSVKRQQPQQQQRHREQRY